MKERTNMSEEVLEKKSKKPIVITIVLIAVIVIVTLLIISLTSKGGTGYKYQSKLDEAQRYVDELSYELAIASFEEAIAIDPVAVEAYIGLAGVYLEMDDTDSAIATLERALACVSENDKAIVLAEIERINGELESASGDEEIANDTEDIVAESSSLDENIPNMDGIMHDVEMVLFHGETHRGWDMQYMAASYRRELAMPLIEKLEEYIAWLELHRDDEKYASLFLYDNEILDPRMYSWEGEVIDGVFFINYLEAYHYLLRLYMYMDDLDGAYAVRIAMNDVFGSEVVPLENFEIEYENEHENAKRMYDVYERVVWYAGSYTYDGETYNDEASYEYDGANRVRLERPNEYYEYEYDSEGRVIKAGHGDKWEVYEYPEFGTILCTVYDSYNGAGKTEVWSRFDEYGGIIE